MDILPPKEKKQVERTIATSVRIKASLLEEIDSIAKETGYSRSEVIQRFLQYAAEQFRSSRQRHTAKR